MVWWVEEAIWVAAEQRNGPSPACWKGVVMLYKRRGSLRLEKCETAVMRAVGYALMNGWHGRPSKWFDRDVGSATPTLATKCLPLCQCRFHENAFLTIE